MATTDNATFKVTTWARALQRAWQLTANRVAYRCVPVGTPDDEAYEFTIKNEPRAINHFRPTEGDERIS